MRRTLVYGILLASAFSPLLVILSLFRALETKTLLAFAVPLLFFLPVIFLGIYLKLAKSITASKSVVPTKVSRQDEQVLAFMSSYLLPIATALLGEDQTTLIPTSLLVGLLALIYIRAGMIHLNPVLAAFGYRLYSVELKNGSTKMLLSRQAFLPQKEPIERITELNDYVYVQWRKS